MARAGLRGGDRRDLALERRVGEFVVDRDLLHAGDAVLLLLSGGADSMAMLDLVRAVDRRLGLGLTLEALHVDYARRGADSARDRAIVTAACERLQLRLHVMESGPAPRGQNFQAWAREVRYAAATRLADARRLDLIASAHNRDDQAETVLYRLTKYGGPAGLTGMPARDGRLVRPLLCLGAAEIRAYCRRRGVDYGDDVSNMQPVYARNRLRLNVLPELALINPRVGESLADTAEIAALEAEVVAAAVDQAWGRVLATGERETVGSPPAQGAASQEAVAPGSAVIDVRRLATEAPVLRALCLRRLLAQALGDETLVARRLIAAVQRLAAAAAGSATVALPGGLEVAREYELLFVRRRAAAHACEPVVVDPPGGWLPGAVATVMFCDRRFTISLTPRSDIAADPKTLSGAAIGLSRPPGRVWLRHPRPGERFAPDGAAQPRSLARLLLAAKVSRGARPRAVVVEVDGEIAWLGAGGKAARPPAAGRSVAGEAARLPVAGRAAACGDNPCAGFAVARVAQSFVVTQSTDLVLNVIGG